MSSMDMRMDVPTDYQSVKRNLVWFTAFASFVVTTVYYAYVVPESHREAVNAFLSRVLPLGSASGGVGITFIVTSMATLLVYYLEVHHQLYDRMLVRWRFYYDTDFIIPRLVRPFGHCVNERFDELSRTRRGEVMTGLFYHFVSDYEQDHRIRQGTIVRFYEAITKYWMTQILEMLLWLVILATLFYDVVYLLLSLPVQRLMNVLYLVVGIFLVNRWLAWSAREGVRTATAEEIREIHELYRGELEERLKELHGRYGLRYGTRRG